MAKGDMNPSMPNAVAGVDMNPNINTALQGAGSNMGIGPSLGGLSDIISRMFGQNNQGQMNINPPGMQKQMIPGATPPTFGQQLGPSADVLNQMFQSFGGRQPYLNRTRMPGPVAQMPVGGGGLRGNNERSNNAV